MGGEDELTVGVTLTENERNIRERFVAEYLVDYNPLAAAIRVGYAETYARTFASQFMHEPYVLQLISAKEQELGVTTEHDKHKQKIITRLYAIANNNNASASAQVAALSKLSSIFGLDAPVKTVQEVIQKEEGPDLSHLSVAELEQMKKMLYGPKPEPAQLTQ